MRTQNRYILSETEGNDGGFKDGVQYVKDIIYFVFRHHKVLCELRDLCEKDKTPFLLKPAETRWGSICASFVSGRQPVKDIHLRSPID